MYNIEKLKKEHKSLEIQVGLLNALHVAYEKSEETKNEIITNLEKQLSNSQVIINTLLEKDKIRDQYTLNLEEEISFLKEGEFYENDSISD